MDKNYSIESGTEPYKIIELLEDKIYEHNTSKINKHDGCLFSRVAKNENKDIIAGIAGWTWAGVCEITQLWVDENVRKNEIGKMLLEAAEAEAKSKYCHTILVRSYSFQAPHFYEKYGFKIGYILNDFPEEHSYYILTKKLVNHEPCYHNSMLSSQLLAKKLQLPTNRPSKKFTQ
jgi:N-acetylglutamate synthase-like GNAT family acetyltransferase